MNAIITLKTWVKTIFLGSIIIPMFFMAQGGYFEPVAFFVVALYALIISLILSLPTLVILLIISSLVKTQRTFSIWFVILIPLSFMVIYIFNTLGSSNWFGMLIIPATLFVSYGLPAYFFYFKSVYDGQDSVSNELDN